MAEEWLERLARQIKDKEHKGAEDAARSRQRIQALGDKGPIFWKSFSDALDASITDLKGLLEGDVTLSEGPLHFGIDPSTQQVTLSKAAFPTVRFTATPRFEREMAEITYVHAGGGSEATSMSCQFAISNEGRVTMRLDGRGFANPTDAATFVMERLFRIPAAQRAPSQDSHLGRVGSE